ncbi:MAG: hypothetical protein R3F59_37945 [Myxococcota bacterium]
MRLNALIDVVGIDDRGRSFSMKEGVSLPVGKVQRVVVPLRELVPADGGAPLDPQELVLLQLVDRTGIRTSGDNQFWLDDLILR